RPSQGPAPRTGTLLPDNKRRTSPELVERPAPRPDRHRSRLAGRPPRAPRPGSSMRPPRRPSRGPAPRTGTLLPDNKRRTSPELVERPPPPLPRHRSRLAGRPPRAPRPGSSMRPPRRPSQGPAPRTGTLLPDNKRRTSPELVERPAPRLDRHRSRLAGRPPRAPRPGSSMRPPRRPSQGPAPRTGTLLPDNKRRTSPELVERPAPRLDRHRSRLAGRPPRAPRPGSSMRPPRRPSQGPAPRTGTLLPDNKRRTSPELVERPAPRLDRHRSRLAGRPPRVPRPGSLMRPPRRPLQSPAPRTGTLLPDNNRRTSPELVERPAPRLDWHRSRLAGRPPRAPRPGSSMRPPRRPSQSPAPRTRTLLPENKRRTSPELVERPAPRLDWHRSRLAGRPPRTPQPGSLMRPPRRPSQSPAPRTRTLLPENKRRTSPELVERPAPRLDWHRSRLAGRPPRTPQPGSLMRPPRRPSQSPAPRTRTLLPENKRRTSPELVERPAPRLDWHRSRLAGRPPRTPQPGSLMRPPRRPSQSPAPRTRTLLPENKRRTSPELVERPAPRLDWHRSRLAGRPPRAPRPGSSMRPPRRPSQSPAPRTRTLLPENKRRTSPELVERPAPRLDWHRSRLAGRPPRTPQPGSLMRPPRRPSQSPAPRTRTLLPENKRRTSPELVERPAPRLDWHRSRLAGRPPRTPQPGSLMRPPRRPSQSPAPRTRTLLPENKRRTSPELVERPAPRLDWHRSRLAGRPPRTPQPGSLMRPPRRPSQSPAPRTRTLLPENKRRTSPELVERPAPRLDWHRSRLAGRPPRTPQPGSLMRPPRRPSQSPAPRTRTLLPENKRRTSPELVERPAPRLDWHRSRLAGRPPRTPQPGSLMRPPRRPSQSPAPRTRTLLPENKRRTSPELVERPAPRLDWHRSRLAGRPPRVPRPGSSMRPPRRPSQGPAPRTRTLLPENKRRTSPELVERPAPRLDWHRSRLAGRPPRVPRPGSSMRPPRRPSQGPAPRTRTLLPENKRRTSPELVERPAPRLDWHRSRLAGRPPRVPRPGSSMRPPRRPSQGPAPRTRTLLPENKRRTSPELVERPAPRLDWHRSRLAGRPPRVPRPGSSMRPPRRPSQGPAPRTRTLLPENKRRTSPELVERPAPRLDWHRSRLAGRPPRVPRPGSSMRPPRRPSQGPAPRTRTLLPENKRRTSPELVERPAPRLDWHRSRLAGRPPRAPRPGSSMRPPRRPSQGPAPRSGPLLPDNKARTSPEVRERPAP